MRIITQTPLGKLLVAATSKGVCEVSFVDDDTPLEKQESLQKTADSIISYLSGESQLSEIKLDIQGTEFQKIVWQALYNIPHGTTSNYKQVAADIGKPKAIRAVANACAANKIMLFIPCHRVIRENGKISGYRFGISRKTKLLELEKNAVKLA